MEEAGLYLAIAWIAARLLPLTTDQGLGVGSEWHMTPLDLAMKLEGFAPEGLPARPVLANPMKAHRL